MLLLSVLYNLTEPNYFSWLWLWRKGILKSRVFPILYGDPWQMSQKCPQLGVLGSGCTQNQVTTSGITISGNN
jgi:hypothetical protein